MTTDPKNVYEKFESRVSKSNPDLSINEYKILLNIGTLSKNRINNTIIIHLIKGLENKTINPETILNILIEGINSDEHLLTLSLLLRHSKELNNKYISSNGMNTHIIVYVHQRYLQNLPMMNTILLLLLFSGNEFILDPTVSDWLRQNYKDSIALLDKSVILTQIDNKLRNKIAILLNKPELLLDFDNLNIIEIIRDNSTQVFLRIFHKIEEFKNKIVDLCIKYSNEAIFHEYLNRGFIVRYYQINLIVLHIKSVESGIIKDIFKNMLKDYINHGGYLDIYQEALINKSGNITKAITDDLIEKNLLESRYSTDTIKDTFVLNVKKSYINHGGSYSPDPRLEHPKKNDNYLDLLIVESKVITPDMLEYLIDNPGNIPSEKMQSIKTQRGLLKRLGFNVNNTKHKSLEHYVNDTKFSNIEKAFGILLKLNTQQLINNLSVIEMETILNLIEGNPIPLLNLLTVSHFNRTFAISCYEMSEVKFEEVMNCFIQG